MSTRHAVLGLLIEEPDHGYSLARRIQERLGEAQVRSTYVYRLLKELEQDGLIRRAEVEPRGRRPARVVYEATELGERDFGGWMRAPLALTLFFEELLVKIAVSRVEDLPELLVLVRQRERDCLAMERKLKEPDRPPAAEAHSPGEGWSRTTAVMLRNLGIDNLQTMTAWLQRMALAMDRAIEEERRAQRLRERAHRRR
ncbi:MAG: PadR family transcriptional regulator [Solirubrobacteraceae bacterium]